MTHREREQALIEAKQALLNDPAISEWEKALLREVSLAVRPVDRMYHSIAHHYLSVGLSAIGCIDAVVTALDRRPSLGRPLHPRYELWLRTGASFRPSSISGRKNCRP